MPTEKITIRKRVTVEQKVEQKQGQPQPQPQPAQPQQPEKPEQPKQPPQEPQQKTPPQPQKPPQRPPPNPQQQRPPQQQKARPPQKPQPQQPQKPQSPQQQQQQRAWGQQLAANRQRARRMPTLAPDARLLQQPQRAQEAGEMGAEDEDTSVQDQAEEQARQAQMQQALPAMLQQAQAMQSEQALSNPQMRRQADRMIKEYQMRMELLRKDIHRERDVHVAQRFNSIQTWWRGFSDSVDALNLGTFWTIANWIQSVVMPFIMIWRAWQFTKIAYSNVKRQMARRARVVKKAMWRFIITTLVTLIENVPIINIIPAWSLAQWIQRYLERREVIKLQRLLLRIAATERAVKRLLALRARSAQQRYAAALMAKGAITNLENEFDKL